MNFYVENIFGYNDWKDFKRIVFEENDSFFEFNIIVYSNWLRYVLIL